MELFLPTRFDDLDLQEGLDLVLLENAFHSFANLLVGLELILKLPPKSRPKGEKNKVDNRVDYFLHTVF